MSGLNFTRERAEAYSNINNLSPSKLFSQDWLAKCGKMNALRTCGRFILPKNIRSSARPCPQQT